VKKRLENYNEGAQNIANSSSNFNS